VYLAGAVFEPIADAEGVLKEAERHLPLLTGIAALLWPGLKTPTIDRVVREQDDGTRKGFIFLSASVVVGAKVTAASGDPSGLTQGQEMLDSANRRPHLFTAVTLWSEAPKSWPRSFRILEEIEQQLSVRVDNAGLCSSTERDRFTRTANTAEVAGSDSRHASRKFQPPANPMALSEAVSFVSRMLQGALRRP
jgi:hypothetical protein